MNAKTATGAPGPAAPRPLSGSTASLTGARALIAAAQSVFLIGHADAEYDF
jgi:hypothetical protein